MATSGRTVRQVLIEETKKFLAVAAYLWAILALLIEYKSVILAEADVSIETRGLALINALALGKIIVVADAFHLGEMAEDTPLIYPTLLKSALFSMLLAGFKILEVGIVGLFHHRPFAESITEIGGGTLKGIICVTLIMFVVLIPFFAYGEMRRVLGRTGCASSSSINARLRDSPRKPERRRRTTCGLIHSATLFNTNAT